MRKVLAHSIAFLLLLFLSVPTKARAEDSVQALNGTVQGLLGQCKAISNRELDKTEQDSLGAMYCLGYVSGAVDFLKMIGFGLSGTGAGICGNVSYEAAVQAFVNWATSHPEQWTNDRLIGITSALRETWACKKSN